MLNQCVFVGRIKTIEKDNDNSLSVTITVPRSFKNENGEYETDTISCIIYENIANSVEKYCKENDLIGIKGRAQSIKDKMQIVAEKITFLSSNKNNS